MENVTADRDLELPRVEALARLYELRDMVERHIAMRGVHNPRSESERHIQLHGHRLSYGCCKGYEAAQERLHRRGPG